MLWKANTGCSAEQHRQDSRQISGFDDQRGQIIRDNIANVRRDISADQRKLEQLRVAADLAGLGGEHAALPDERFFITPDGLRLRYLDWGGEGRHVVLLHGGALTAETWDVVCLSLRSGFRCVSLDQRGHGESDWSPDAGYSPSEHAEDLAALIAHTKLHRPILVGHSMGGTNALLHASQPGASVAGLVIVDITPVHDFVGADHVLRKARRASTSTDLESMLGVAAALNRWQDPRLRERTLTTNLRQRAGGGWAFKHDERHLDPDVIEATRQTMATLVDRLELIRCPTLLVRGAESRIVSRSDMEALALRLADTQLLEIGGAGHNVQGDRPLELAAAIRRFAESWPGQDP